jgi:hypothetical protein
MSLHVRSLSLETVHLWFVLVLIVCFDCLVQVLACPQITEGASSHQRQEPSETLDRSLKLLDRKILLKTKM